MKIRLQALAEKAKIKLQLSFIDNNIWNIGAI